MNIPNCARCGFVVYPAEKVSLIGQNWHKACFHCEVCKMVLTANNFLSHQKRPYCQVHNPRNNTFTSVYETPININAKKQAEAVSEIKYREEGERFMSTFHYDMRSKELEQACRDSQMANQVKYLYILPHHIKIYEQSKGKGSFPAMLTPGYEVAKKANTLASNVEYKKGHEERVSKYTTVTDTPEVVLAKSQGRIASDVVYTEEYDQQRGKGSFPAHVTPGYKVAKKANEMASKVKYQQQYEQEIKGKSSTDAGAAELTLAKENTEKFSQDYEQQRGKGSFPAMITPGYQMAKKAHDMASDLKYKKDLNKMKGSSAYHSLNPDDNLTLKNARKINKLVSENKYKEKYTSHMKGHYEGTGLDKKTMHAMKVRKLASDIAYKSEYEQEKTEQGEYNYPADITPSYQTQKKLEPLKDKNYRQHIDKLKYSQVTDTPDIVQARINAHQLSNLNYKADYEKTKTQYTLAQDMPLLKKAKANAELISDIKYREDWEKSKSKACDIGLDTLTFKAAKASRDLASDIKYKESYAKNKDKVVGVNVSDSKTLHCLQVGKLSSEIAYKKGSKETHTKYNLPLDMVNLSHAKKAQALASDLDYRTKLHEYTILPDDIKVQQAKKAYNLQSDNQYRSDLTWMKGVGWEAEGCMDVEQAKKAGELVSEKKYRQKVDGVKFTQVADTLSIKHAKKSQELQSDLTYKAGTEQMIHQYSLSKDEPLYRQARANADLLSNKIYKSSWEAQREKGFELRMDALSILTAKAKRDLASDVKYKQQYEITKGKMIGVKTVTDDSQMAHSALATKLQSNRNYKKEYEDSKTKYSASLDMMTISHAKKAQDLATETKYRTFLHKYTSLPSDMKVEWAKKAYGLQSDKKYRSDLNWMKGVGWETTGSLDVQQAKKASDLISETKYRQNASALKFTSVEDTPEMVQAKLSNKLAIDRLYREKGENEKHIYTLTGDLPEHMQAKINALNLSETRYKESWTKLRDAGYKLRLDAIPFQAAKSSTEILSDQKYKEQFEKMKGKMIGLKGLQDDINMAHSVYATQLQSNSNYKKDSAKAHTQLHLPMDMLDMVHAKKAQALLSEQNYRHTLHHYTALPDDLKVQAAKRAYELQSEKAYRSDLNYLRGAAWIATGALQIEGSKHATDLISEKKYRQQPYAFKHTSITDSPDIIHAMLSNKITNERLYKEKDENIKHNYTITAERPELTQAKINAANYSDSKYKESWHTLRAQGYKLTMQDIPFQAAKASTGIASDYQYKHSHILEKGKHIGARSIMDDTHLLHCLRMAGLQSDKNYRRDAVSASSQYHLGLDLLNLSHARKAQALASDQDYKSHLHSYTVLPDDMKVQWAKKAYELQSQNVYKSDLNFMKGVAWDTVGAPQLESAKRAGELISDVSTPSCLLSVDDDPRMRHSLAMGKLQSDNEYKKQFHESCSHYKIHADQPEFLHAKKSQAQASERSYRQHIHNYTCDPEQLNVKHAKQAYKLQSDVSGSEYTKVFMSYNVYKPQTGILNRVDQQRGI
uniref:LIM zinc-binding domain-containing protein n=1 Tax=Electrophorus electricus TaxID=8005 RepID=A0A4W4EJZ7_ELEEL